MSIEDIYIEEKNTVVIPSMTIIPEQQTVTETLSWQISKYGWVSWNDMFLPCLWVRSLETGEIYRTYLNDWIVLQLEKQEHSIYTKDKQNSINENSNTLNISQFIYDLTQDFQTFIEQTSIAHESLVIGLIGKKIAINTIPTKNTEIPDENEYLLQLLQKGYDHAWICSGNLQTNNKESLEKHTTLLIEKYGLQQKQTKNEELEQFFQQRMKEEEYLSIIKELVYQETWIKNVEYIDLQNAYWDPEHQFQQTGSSNWELKKLTSTTNLMGHLMFARGDYCGFTYDTENYVVYMPELVGYTIKNLEDGF